jgi:hypothetical protein
LKNNEKMSGGGREVNGGKDTKREERGNERKMFGRSTNLAWLVDFDGFSLYDAFAFVIKKTL